MELLGAARVRDLIDPCALVEALRDAFAHPDATTVPERGHYRIDDDLGATLLVMPAWTKGDLIGVKVVGHYPRNSERGLAAIHGSYLLADATTGVPVAVLDGTELTRLRTAAASALAADYLAPAQIGEHLLIGAGNVNAAIPAMYAAVRQVARTRVWARKPEQAMALVERLRADGFEAQVADNLREAVREADVITAATSATSPLVLGADVRPGTHVDLIGAFSPSMIEADEELITSASLFIDVPAALQEPGDLLGPLERGTLTEEDVKATLADLAAGRHTGRSTQDEVTVFKSVGSSLEDLVAARLAWSAHSS